jgi:predicted dehydrogenase
MWLTNGVHVVDRLTWLMASQAVSVSASIGTRAHYQAADDTATALIRYKNGLAGAAISIAFADGPPIMDTQVICTNGTVRIGGGRQPFLQVGQGNEWEEIPYDDPPAVMHHEWKGFIESIEQDIEPPASGEWSRHIMEILFAAESSAITGQDVVLQSGLSWTHQRGGIPVTRDHGWI